MMKVAIRAVNTNLFAVLISTWLKSVDKFPFSFMCFEHIAYLGQQIIISSPK